MALTPQQFFSKNLKWIALIIFVLFIFKTAQSCNRGMSLNMSKGEYINQIDSLKTMYNTYYKEAEDSIKDLNYSLKYEKGTGIATKNELERTTSERINSLEKEKDYIKEQNNIKDKRIEDLQKYINILEQKIEDLNKIKLNDEMENNK
jgi:hypothetical protein